MLFLVLATEFSIVRDFEAVILCYESCDNVGFIVIDGRTETPIVAFAQSLKKYFLPGFLQHLHCTFFIYSVDMIHRDKRVLLHFFETSW